MDYTSDYVYDPANKAVKQEFLQFVAKCIKNLHSY